MMPVENLSNLASELAQELKLPANYQEPVKTLLGEVFHQALEDTTSTVPHAGIDLFEHKLSIYKILKINY
jgi:hypothetical protein